jgi:hypothetical protein
MKEFIETINDFLNQRTLKAKDVIIVSVLSSFFFWILSGFIKKIWSLLLKLIKWLKSYCKKIIRKYVKQQLTVNELLEVEKRLQNGGELRWYEKKSYYGYKKATKEMGEMLKDTFSNFKF